MTKPLVRGQDTTLVTALARDRLLSIFGDGADWKGLQRLYLSEWITSGMSQKFTVDKCKDLLGGAVLSFLSGVEREQFDDKVRHGPWATGPSGGTQGPSHYHDIDIALQCFHGACCKAMCSHNVPWRNLV